MMMDEFLDYKFNEWKPDRDRSREPNIEDLVKLYEFAGAHQDLWDYLVECVEKNKAIEYTELVDKVIFLFSKRNKHQIRCDIFPSVIPKLGPAVHRYVETGDKDLRVDEYREYCRKYVDLDYSLPIRREDT